jgi:tRNA1Val (adenine37-N6)-methyltransferase
MKSNADFHFKQFTVTHQNSTHKVGTDGVLLGAWTEVISAGNILDIGTGTGVIALMLAQRTPEAVTIDAIEIEKQDAEVAALNVVHSPWPQKIQVHQTALQDFFPKKKYDLVVANPPYFVNSLLPPEKKRSDARHAHALSFSDLLESTLRLLNPGGRLSLILPYREGLQFIEQSESRGIFCIRKCAFQSRSHKPIERLLLEFSRKAIMPREEALTLYRHGNAWSEDYQELTRDFYVGIRR